MNNNIEFKERKRKRIIKGLLLFLIPIPLFIFVDINCGYPNEIIRIILILITIAITFIGFFLMGTAFIDFDSKNTHILIAGKKINISEIKNNKNLTFMEKMKAYNITGLILKLLSIPCFFGTLYFIFEDPLKFLAQFKNVARAQIIAVFILVNIGNALYILIEKKRLERHVIVIYIITNILMLAIFYYLTIPA